jgi:alkylated DNA nucleotide flippase Atl1
VIREVPRGRVATYGQIALLCGLAGRARQVGYALHALPPGSPVPWQRVLNARGELSLAAAAGDRQRPRCSPARASSSTSAAASTSAASSGAPATCAT